MLDFTVRSPKPEGLELLCLGAHPDDIELGCGGTVLKLCREYERITVHWVVLAAHGDRSAEARAGAERFRRGSSENGQLLLRKFRDGYFPFQGADIKDFFEELEKEISPDIIFTHGRADRHQDHRLVSDLTWNTWRDHLILEYEVPKWDGDLGTINAYSPLTSEIARTKIDAIMETFSTQKGKHWFSEGTFHGLMRLRGVECRAPEGLAEAFLARKFVAFP